MTADTAPERALDRRFLMRGGAVLAGAAGLAAVGAATAPTAQAATGQFMVVGQPNSADLSTTITTTNSATTPTLSLVNSSGPSLKLNPLSNDFDAPLAVGEIVNTSEGPLMGVDYGDGAETTYLVTGGDLSEQPATFAIYPERYLDTRVPETRDSVVGSSTSAPFDSKGRLKAGQWIDVGIAPQEMVRLSGVFLNLTSVKPAAGGFLSVYPAGAPKPVTSTVNFQVNESVANAAFVALGVVGDVYAVRVYAESASHVIVDLTGVVLGGFSNEPTAQASASGRPTDQIRRLAKMRRAAVNRR